jgi:predicted PolB exonuclease-like 3'-5' exonuclease
MFTAIQLLTAVNVVNTKSGSEFLNTYVNICSVMKETFPKIVKVRRTGKNNEAILHAPKVAKGRYTLTLEKGGVLKYTPVPVAAEPEGS